MGLIIDSFAGGGGASTGIKMALGRDPDIAINHNAEAMAMHKANHPNTKHYIEDIWGVDPLSVTKGEPVDLMWLSPDCTHFSKARGSKPRSERIRGLAWAAVKWARRVHPRLIILENVEEFQDWCPLKKKSSMPKMHLRGVIFDKFVRHLRREGYSVSYRELIASEYGAPTTRKRFFLIATSDRIPASWPTPTHGSGLLPFKTAAECIDWSIPCNSIFERKKELAEATKRRIATGIMRYVVNNPNPYIVGGLWRKKEHAELVAALLLKYHGEHQKKRGEFRGQGLEKPLTSSDHNSLTVCHLIRQFGTSNGASLNKPLGTIMPGGSGGKSGIVAAFLVKYYGNGNNVIPLTKPIDTIVGKDRFGLVSVMIEGETYIITDIGMRMLSPRELFDAQGFPHDYIINPIYKGKPLTKTAQVRMCGNSVCPPMAEALIRANYIYIEEREAA